MSCNHCTTKFNFFHKEIGCSNCRLSFCSKCLKQKIKIPNKGDVELPVCKTCYVNLSSNVNANAAVNIPPPDAYLKRLEELENPSPHPITVYKENKRMANLRSGLSAADQQLLDRLEKLKDKSTPPTEDDIRKRLNNLKGGNEYVEGPSTNPVVTTETKSDQEQVDSLLEMFVKERDIELAHNPEEGIVARLATLRGQGVRPNEGAYITNLHDSGSDDEVDKITKKIMDEVSLDDKCSNVLNKDVASDSTERLEEKKNSSPELPWCVLCNNDAKYRCLDCDDLYCASCNVEVHKTWGDTDHKIVDYKQQ
ncbi:hypothetical protein RN001_000604 [Aquatica leii]|uniref:FYVE-type domain-containing protein n=1 Tax=Aquatica leii TaxID=1421715 RepID=A0AAN7PFJ6_9COLE|nr:hypothetical protein RN001_000604 [Aquatica leii]